MEGARAGSGTPIKSVTISELRNNFSAYLREVAEKGMPLTVTVREKQVASLVPVGRETEKELYPLRGLGSWISPDFDDPLEEFLMPETAQ
jgi:prevent-host-death family protein